MIKLNHNLRIKNSFIFVLITMKLITQYSVFIVLTLIVFNSNSFGQTTESESARSALKTGSSKELVSMLDSEVELVIHGQRYNKNNSEGALKKFFTDNPPSNFKYIHNGASKDGSLSYSIGHYESVDSKYRIVLRFKKNSGVYKIHKIEVSDF
jgi:hypothetical protein